MINYIQLGISLVVPMIAVAVMWGKHTESVKAAHAKDIEQDKELKNLRTLITSREDLLRKQIADVNEKLDKIIIGLAIN